VNYQVGRKPCPKSLVDFIFELVKGKAWFDVAALSSSIAGGAIDDFIGNSNQGVDVSDVLANFGGQ
jgi:hypothetical protein